MLAFLFAMVVLVLFTMPRTSLAADDSYYHIREIKPNVFVWVAEDILNQGGDPEFNRAGNAGFIITPEGVIVVNTTNSPFNARALLFEIRKRTDQPVRYVINTGASPDVMLGNEAFEDFQPVILSTPEAAQAMRDYKNEFPARLGGNWKIAASMRGVHPLPPTGTFEKEDTLQLGGQEIRLINLGDNTSPGDAAVFLPASKVLFLGNVFENEYIPRIGSANINQWIETLLKVESWDAEVYVPAHGLPGGKAQVRQFRGFLEWLYGRVRSGFQEGKSLAQIQGEMVPFPNLHWHAPELESEAVAAVFRLLARSESQASSSAETPSP
jgi:glyoxylase-like metal-dependent hydrolase (beta-lactamase superfamily II)